MPAASSRALDPLAKDAALFTGQPQGAQPPRRPYRRADPHQLQFAQRFATRCEVIFGRHDQVAFAPSKLCVQNLRERRQKPYL